MKIKKSIEYQLESGESIMAVIYDYEKNVYGLSMIGGNVRILTDRETLIDLKRDIEEILDTSE